ncbi:MAG: AfsR/SARP family transcriptional regulator [Ktedonobacteraceae bacterium]
MHPLPLFDQDMFARGPEATSVISLIEQALGYLSQGGDAVGASLCSLACERLTSDQADIGEIMKTFLTSHAYYCQAQQALHEASRRFVQAEAEQQQLRLRIEQMLTLLREKAETPLFSVSTQSSNILHYRQSARSPEPASTRLNGHAHEVQSAQADEHTKNAEHMNHVDKVKNPLPALSITCFGKFEVRRQGQPIAPCQNRNGQTILRYLMIQSGYRVTLDTLMALLWPDDDADVARHKVHVAVSALRNSLNQGLHSMVGGGYILYKNGVYQLNPAVSLTTDIEQFLALYQRGRQSGGTEAITCYEQACQLYSGPLLQGDLYADWSVVRREQLNQCFGTMCRALTGHYLDTGQYEKAEQWARAVLKENCCDEEAHRQLIHIYIAQGRRSEAIRQYQSCERILAEELGVPPMAETIATIRNILTRSVSYIECGRNGGDTIDNAP